MSRSITCTVTRMVRDEKFEAEVNRKRAKMNEIEKRVEEQCSIMKKILEKIENKKDYLFRINELKAMVVLDIDNVIRASNRLLNELDNTYKMQEEIKKSNNKDILSEKLKLKSIVYEKVKIEKEIQEKINKKNELTNQENKEKLGKEVEKLQEKYNQINSEFNLNKSSVDISEIKKMEKESLKNNILIDLKVLKDELDDIVEEHERIIFENIYERIEKLENEVKNNFDEKLEDELRKLKEDKISLIDRIELLHKFMKSLEKVEFDIKDLRYNKEKDELFLLARKENKEGEFVIKDNKIYSNFENYQGDECLKEYEKVAKFAKETYNLSYDLSEHKSAPLKNSVQYVNRGGSI